MVVLDSSVALEMPLVLALPVVVAFAARELAECPRILAIDQ